MQIYVISALAVRHMGVFITFHNRPMCVKTRSDARARSHVEKYLEDNYPKSDGWEHFINIEKIEIGVILPGALIASAASVRGTQVNNTGLYKTESAHTVITRNQPVLDKPAFKKFVEEYIEGLRPSSQGWLNSIVIEKIEV